MATAHPTTAPRRRSSGIVRLAWFVVLAMMLAAAAWSISDQLTRWGMPTSLAYGISIMFDAAGLLAAEYARRAVERGTGAGLPRASIFAFVGVAGILNYHHGHAIGGIAAAIAFASLSGMVELLFELHRRDVRDTVLVERGLVAELLPRVPLIAWCMFPVRSWRTLRAAVGVRLDNLDPMRTDAPSPVDEQPARATATIRAAIRAAAATMPTASPEQLVDQLDAVGIDTDIDTVRHVVDTIDTAPTRHVDDASPSIADTVRDLVEAGIDTLDDVVAAVEDVHGPVVRSTVWTTLKRAREAAVKKAARA
ncbi:hypothetical protein [Streptomyces sp. SID3343]|uniref:hypothetical protein n=1 Tax=Streptomyces sp. SID3343 TaxID=2690260 RepID=UPI00136BC051|nr:hypothetical protein [Streptomyces sp. SID3343]MYW03479.1 hypothetical protein [Streptomyces sp. SID3343]